MSFNVSKALEAVNGYLSEVDSLLRLFFDEGMDAKDGLRIRLEHFIAFTFPDGKERLKNFRSSFPMQVSTSSHVATEDEMQEEYEQDLKVMRDNLLAYKEEMQLKEPKGTKPSKIDKSVVNSSLIEKETVERMFDDIITHPLIKEASQNHFKNGEYRPAVLDAMIGLEVMIKEKANYPKDNAGKELSGVRLMHRVFDPDRPILNWCKGEHQIERDELEGYKFIFAGAMQGIRDTKAHAIFEISPVRALKLLTLATLLAELVDASEVIA
jgi:uncharacterized protein (TIGR02391 family)